jgi:hypothetical protein
MDEMWLGEEYEANQDRWYEWQDDESLWSDPAEWEDDPMGWNSDVLTSAGWGTDEDYGHYAPDPWE